MQRAPGSSAWIVRSLVACALLVVACAPAAQPSPTAAPAKPAEAKPAATTAPAKPAEAPAAKPAEAKPVEAKPAASPAAKAEAKSEAKPAASPAAKEQSLDALYEAAKKEGVLSLYLSMSTSAKETLPAAFEKRFPGVKIDHIDATADKLVARAISEARGGRTLGDVFGGTPIYLAQMREQKLLEDFTIPEAAAYPATLKGKDWNATDTQFFVVGWNTTQVKAGEEPKQFEDLADPKWKGKIIAEPRDWQVLMGLAQGKLMDDAKAEDLMKRIAANNPEFHRGHSDLIELLVAGQGAVSATCYAHHFPPRIEKGAPIKEMMTEGVGEVGGTVALFKGAPHPNAAMLWIRWATSEEGQKMYAQAGETPAHPNVAPKANFKPEKVYYLGADEQVRDAKKYEDKWKAIFNIR